MGKDINDGAEVPEVVQDVTFDKKDIAHVERTLSGTDEKGDHANYDRIDDEVAKYANASGDAIIITEEENKRLKSLIDRRVLPIMMFTYFLQALDKGTMSFTSIMGIRDDIPILLKSSYVSQSSYPVCTIPNVSPVGVAHHLYIHRCSCCRIPNELDYPARACRKIPGFQHPSMEYYSLLPRSVLQFPSFDRRSYLAWCFRGCMPARFPYYEFDLVQARGTGTGRQLLVYDEWRTANLRWPAGLRFLSHQASKLQAQPGNSFPAVVAGYFYHLRIVLLLVGNLCSLLAAW
jgi:hypothetical protein